MRALIVGLRQPGGEVPLPAALPAGVQPVGVVDADGQRPRRSPFQLDLSWLVGASDPPLVNRLRAERVPSVQGSAGECVARPRSQGWRDE